MKRVVTLLIIMLLGAGLVGCNDKEIDNLEWKNENAVYAVINSKFKNDILKDVEGSFNFYSFEKVYITSINIGSNDSISLLFILNSIEIEEKERFKKQLSNDSRISYVNDCYDLPFESVDTRYIECKKNIINIGETLMLELKGNKNYYVPQFDFNGFLAKPKYLENKKTYKINDFPKIGINKIEELENGWLYFKLANGGYFNLIKAMDKIARLDNIEEIDVDKRNITLIPPIIWSSSNKRVVDFIEFDENNYGKVTIKGLSKGETIVNYDGVFCKITVE